LRELVAVAACIVLLIGVSVPGVSSLRRHSRLAMCKSNLGDVFRGVSSYRASFDGAIPFAGNQAGAVWLPSGARDRPYASNSRHLYTLVRLDYVRSLRSFICPADKNTEPMRRRPDVKYDDFTDCCNVSYASLNLGGPNPRLRPRSMIAYVSDTNPLFPGARFDPTVDPDRTNSPAHGGRGQVVLTLDGSTHWITRPVYGRQEDNLWVIRDVRRYTGAEAPTSDDDVQLVPGFPATDPTVSAQLRPRTMPGHGL
jgi:hypothetical protein